MEQTWEVRCMQLELMTIVQKGDCGCKKHVLPWELFPSAQAKKLADQKHKQKQA